MERRLFYIDKAAYANLLSVIDNLHITERKGNLADFQLYIDDEWLIDTAIIEHLTRSQGEWQVELLFASIHNPLKFLKRRIGADSCPERAAQQAHSIRRHLTKDQRGNLSVSVDQLNICSN